MTLAPNAIYQVLASSGSGKTTLVSILAGLRGDYNGTLFINQKPANGFRPDDWSRWRSKDMSIVFQDLRLFPELTGIDNIELSAKLAGAVTDRAQITSMAEQLGVAHKLDTTMRFLSFGQMQRMAIIRALNRPYNWLILDEPFSHLDQKNAETAWALIIQNAREKKAGVLITSLDPYTFIHPDRQFIL
ncbi:MAG: ATP-binding cassette domain-containing protein [Ferruginibacter sp.]